jgi:hypothetical protein
MLAVMTARAKDLPQQRRRETAYRHVIDFVYIGLAKEAARRDDGGSPRY